MKDIPYPLLRLVGGTLGRRYWLLAPPILYGRKRGGDIIWPGGSSEREKDGRLDRGTTTMTMKNREKRDILEINDCWFIR